MAKLLVQLHFKQNINAIFYGHLNRLKKNTEDQTHQDVDAWSKARMEVEKTPETTPVKVEEVAPTEPPKAWWCVISLICEN
ncbi:unnamed protein product [Lactuca virosa]|uniref:Uncharacterized protein n=1 Tax=Lactuca virosa TaxID=75947 RepID=A0AAU9PME3_9ASTR|nr:unnamed protein product [Lactuca virosa]